MGAEYIEKHVTFDNKLRGPDHKASLTIDKFEIMVNQIRNLELSIGSGVKKVEKSEEQNKKIARNSLVASKKINKDEKFSKSNITIKRPGNGMSPKFYTKIIGKKSNKIYMPDQLIKIKV